jgi:hypothetical protein
MSGESFMGILFICILIWYIQWVLLSLDFGESSLEYINLVSPLLPGTGILCLYFQCVLSPAQICSVTIFRYCPLPLVLQKLIQFFGVCQKGLTEYLYLYIYVVFP